MEVIMEFIFALLVSILCGYACAEIAKKNSNNIVIAWILGILFGLFSVIGYIIADIIRPNNTEN